MDIWYREFIEQIDAINAAWSIGLIAQAGSEDNLAELPRDSLVLTKLQKKQGEYFVNFGGRSFTISEFVDYLAEHPNKLSPAFYYPNFKKMNNKDKATFARLLAENDLGDYCFFLTSEIKAARELRGLIGNFKSADGKEPLITADQSRDGVLFCQNPGNAETVAWMDMDGKPASAFNTATPCLVFDNARGKGREEFRIADAQETLMQVAEKAAAATALLDERLKPGGRSFNPYIWVLATKGTAPDF